MNRILSFYFALPPDTTLGIVTKAFNRIMARICKRILDRTVPKHFIKTLHQYPQGVNTTPREQEVVVSLTSFPARIEEVWIVIECLFRQTYKADKIILWLSIKQFPKQDLPQKLKDQTKRGLDIRFVEEDLRSHKKYIYAFEAFPNAQIITVDDDLYYDHRLIENLILLKKKYPNAVVTNRAHQLNFNKKNEIQKYRNWAHNTTIEVPSYFTVQTGGFGTLYLKDDLDKTYNNMELIKNNIPDADDLWLKVQTLLKYKKVVTNARYNKDPLTVKSSQIEKLVYKNVLRGGNDEQLKAVLKHFGLEDLKQFTKEKRV